MFPDMSSLSFSLFSASAISPILHVSPSDYAYVLRMWISVKNLSLSYRPVFPQGLLNNSKMMICFIFKLSLFQNERIFLFLLSLKFYHSITTSFCLQCGRPGFDPWVGKIPWRRKWQSTPVFLPGKSHGSW